MQYEERTKLVKKEIELHANTLIELLDEPYADILLIMFDKKFTKQHAILLSVLLRHMDCCDLRPIEIFCSQ